MAYTLDSLESLTPTCLENTNITSLYKYKNTPKSLTPSGLPFSLSIINFSMPFGGRDQVPNFLSFFFFEWLLSFLLLVRNQNILPLALNSAKASASSFNSLEMCQ
eukprot:TRINITY_DN2786_c1_g1_i4.p1 TRINITY_DN2786_c1_g1~~TRINITY_DN2786_c1_g1_i4.p1  ORF type:complete len:105 (+),score=11.98 TRINITY_DN2786_c1_g1_i4:1805-2119(+)